MIGHEPTISELLEKFDENRKRIAHVQKEKLIRELYPMCWIDNDHCNKTEDC